MEARLGISTDETKLPETPGEATGTAAPTTTPGYAEITPAK